MTIRNKMNSIMLLHNNISEPFYNHLLVQRNPLKKKKNKKILVRLALQWHQTLYRHNKMTTHTNKVINSNCSSRSNQTSTQMITSL